MQAPLAALRTSSSGAGPLEALQSFGVFFVDLIQPHAEARSLLLLQLPELLIPGIWGLIGRFRCFLYEIHIRMKLQIEFTPRFRGS